MAWYDFLPGIHSDPKLPGSSFNPNWKGPNLPGRNFDLNKKAPAKRPVGMADNGGMPLTGSKYIATPPKTTGTTTKRTGSPVRTDPAAAARAAAQAAADAAQKAAGNRFATQAGNLDPQIAALKHALDVSFKQSLDQNLGDISGLLEEQFNLLKSGSSKRALEFLEGAKNTEKASAGQAETTLSNLVRERQDTLSAVLEHGVGQTDLLRAMVGAARNWHNNAQEGNRAYFDSMQSTNASINDLNVDTQSALANVHTQGESERERMWQDYYNRRSETFTQLGNLYTSQADLLAQAKENKVGEGGDAKKTLSGTAFMDAAKESGLSYTRGALPDWIKDYKGQEKVQAKVQNTNLASAVEFMGGGKAEGASSLRRW